MLSNWIQFAEHGQHRKSYLTSAKRPKKFICPFVKFVWFVQFYFCYIRIFFWPVFCHNLQTAHKHREPNRKKRKKHKPFLQIESRVTFCHAFKNQVSHRTDQNSEITSQRNNNNRRKEKRKSDEKNLATKARQEIYVYEENATKPKPKVFYEIKAITSYLCWYTICDRKDNQNKS